MRSSRQIHKGAVSKGRAVLWLAFSAVWVCGVGCTGSVNTKSSVTSPTPVFVRHFGHRKPHSQRNHHLGAQRRGDRHHNRREQWNLQLFGAGCGDLCRDTERIGFRI